MDNRNILNLKRDVREMQVQHNRLTALCALLLKNMKGLREELSSLRSTGVVGVANNNNNVRTNSPNMSQSRQAKDMNEIHADEILRQLSQQRP